MRKPSITASREKPSPCCNTFCPFSLSFTLPFPFHHRRHLRRRDFGRSQGPPAGCRTWRRPAWSMRKLGTSSWTAFWALTKPSSVTPTSSPTRAPPGRLWSQRPCRNTLPPPGTVPRLSPGAGLHRQRPRKEQPMTPPPSPAFLRGPVSTLQEMLRTISHVDRAIPFLRPTGIFDEDTLAAVMTFQKSMAARSLASWTSKTGMPFTRPISKRLNSWPRPAPVTLFSQGAAPIHPGQRHASLVHVQGDVSRPGPKCWTRSSPPRPPACWTRTAPPTSVGYSATPTSPKPGSWMGIPGRPSCGCLRPS